MSIRSAQILKNVSSYKQNLKQTGGGPPPESIGKLVMTHDIAVSIANGFY